MYLGSVLLDMKNVNHDLNDFIHPEMYGPHSEHLNGLNEPHSVPGREQWPSGQGGPEPSGPVSMETEEQWGSEQGEEGRDHPSNQGAGEQQASP